MRRQPATVEARYYRSMVLVDPDVPTGSVFRPKVSARSSVLRAAIISAARATSVRRRRSWRGSEQPVGHQEGCEADRKIDPEEQRPVRALREHPADHRTPPRC